MADIIEKLEALHSVSGQAGSQLTGIGSLVGGAVDPNTDLGTRTPPAQQQLTGRARSCLTDPVEIVHD